MPYIGQDWRQPGDLWVRTTEGWERMQLWRFRLLENLNENVTERQVKSCLYEYDLLCYCSECFSRNTYSDAINCVKSENIGGEFLALDVNWCAVKPCSQRYFLKLICMIAYNQHDLLTQ